MCNAKFFYHAEFTNLVWSVYFILESYSLKLLAIWPYLYLVMHIILVHF